MKPLKFRRLLLAALYLFPLVWLLSKHSQSWVVPAYTGVAMIWAMPPPYKKDDSGLCFWMMASSWIIAISGASLGLFGVAIGTVINRQEAGLFFGVLMGTLMAAAGLGVIWIVFYLKNQLLVWAMTTMYPDRSGMAMDNSMPSLVLWQQELVDSESLVMQMAKMPIALTVLSVISKGIGLAVLLLFGHLLGGLLGLGGSVMWAIGLSKVQGL